jgi:aerobic carbon-monoxide dehydrogenase small subunit
MGEGEIMRHLLKLKVNSDDYELYVKPNWTLLDVIRDEIGLKGTKKGCGYGECGSCTVLMDGKPVQSCLTLALQAQDKEILTIEGLAENGILHPLQTAFIREGAIQCGFCTPGMILTAYAFLKGHPHPEEKEIKEAVSGNLCRCTGYTNIISAIKSQI